MSIPSEAPTPSPAAPWFAPDQAAALADFWSVYDRHYDAVAIETLRVAEGHPVFGPLVRAMPPEQHIAQNQHSRDMLVGAIVNGEWSAYEADLRMQGSMYAQMGVSFRGWYDIIRAFQRFLVPRMIDEFGPGGARLASALMAMQDFIDRAMATLAEEYLATKERLITAQRTLAEERAAEVLASAASLRRQTTLLDAVVHSIRDGLVVCDDTGTILLANDAAETMIGLRVGDTLRLGGRANRFFHPDGVTPIRAAELPHARALRGLETNDFEMIVGPVSALGGLLISADGRRLDDAESGVSGALVTFRDITERKRLEEARRKSAELSAANRELEAFSYSVAHDLRTPLRSIDGFSQALLEDCGDSIDETGRDHLRRVRNAAQTMATLIDDMLQLARVMRGDLRHEKVDLTAVAHAVLADLRNGEPERVVEVIVEDALTASGDDHLLRLVVENLLSNAWKFTRRRESARIEFRRAEGVGPTFLVRDNGAGFDMAHADKLFSPFQRLHDVRQFAGTGVGLATVRRILDRHGGRIWVESAVDQGAAFFFELPQPASEGP